MLAVLSCGSVYKVRDIEGMNIDSLTVVASALSRFDGLYSLYDTTLLGGCHQRSYEHYEMYSPLIFLNNRNLLWANGGGSQNEVFLKIDSYKQVRFPEQEGVYRINKDTIWAKLPVTLVKRGSLMRSYMACFKGNFKNQDTILDWHMIPPYPNANRRLNDDFQFLLSPHLLHFIESKELLGLDSLYQQQLRAKKP
jgi:hypothetical protein